MFRNAGGVITEDGIRSLALSQRLLGTREIIVIHHTDCGMLTFTDDEFKRSVQHETGIKLSWAAESFGDLEEEVRQSMRRIEASPFVTRHKSLRSFIFDVATGELHEVEANRVGPATRSLQGRSLEAHPGADRSTICPIHRTSPGGRPHMSAPILSFQTAQARRSGVGNLRLRLKPAHRSCGFVQGAWWPRSTQLTTELPLLLAALSPRVGAVDRIIYDKTSWTPASLRMEFRGRSIILEGSSDTSTNILSVIGEGFGRLVLLVVPPYTNPTRAYTAVMMASKPDDVSTPDELLGIGPREAQDRRLALSAQQRWESEGGALRRLGHERGDGAVAGEVQEVRRAQ